MGLECKCPRPSRLLLSPLLGFPLLSCAVLFLHIRLLAKINWVSSPASCRQVLGYKVARRAPLVALHGAGRGLLDAVRAQTPRVSTPDQARPARDQSTSGREGAPNVDCRRRTDAGQRNAKASAAVARLVGTLNQTRGGVQLNRQQGLPSRALSSALLAGDGPCGVSDGVCDQSYPRGRAR